MKTRRQQNNWDKIRMLGRELFNPKIEEIKDLPIRESGIVLPEDWMIQKHSTFNLEEGITKMWKKHTWLSDIREEKPKKDIGFNFRI